MAKPPIPADLVELLRNPNPAVMATVRPDGAPVSVAAWYLWEDGSVLHNLDAGRNRLDHIRADPRVSLTVLDRDSWYRHVSMPGSVTLAPGPDLADIDRLRTTTPARSTATVGGRGSARGLTSTATTSGALADLCCGSARYAYDANVNSRAEGGSTWSRVCAGRRPPSPPCWP